MQGNPVTTKAFYDIFQFFHSRFPVSLSPVFFIDLNIIYERPRLQGYESESIQCQKALNQTTETWIFWELTTLC